MRTPIVLPTLLVSLLLLAVAAPPAGANASDDRIIHDCQHSQTGELTGTYGADELRHARDNLPTDVQEYSGCPDAIRQALIALIGGRDGKNGDGTGGGFGGTGGGFGGTGGGFGGTGGANGTEAPAHVGTEIPVDVAGAQVRPGALPSIGHDAHELPGALIALLVLLGVAALAATATTIGQRVVARHRT